MFSVVESFGPRDAKAPSQQEVFFLNMHSHLGREMTFLLDTHLLQMSHLQFYFLIDVHSNPLFSLGV